MKQVVFTILFIGIFGCSTKPNISKLSADDTLKHLRASLDLVKSAPSDKPFEASTYESDPLIGLSQQKIDSALGHPEACHSTMEKPCGWHYLFYKLPNGDQGGGPELWLQFGRDSLCTSAKWIVTQ